MNNSVKMVIVLTIITLFSGAALALWDDVTAPRIEANRLAVLKAAISTVLPGIEYYDEKPVAEERKVYVGRKTGSEEIFGYAFNAVGNGFSPDLSIMVGVSSDFNKIIGIQILGHTETPGLGNKIEDAEFKNQFEGIVCGEISEIIVVKNISPEDPTKGIQAITGATISSKAVADIIMAEVASLRDLVLK